MVNSTMNKNLQTDTDKPVKTPETKQPVRPNESAAFSVEAHVKIFDPNSKETYVEKRA